MLKREIRTVRKYRRIKQIGYPVLSIFVALSIFLFLFPARTFDSGKIFRVNERGALAFVPDKDGMESERGRPCNFKIIGFLKSAQREEEEFDSFTVVGQNKEVIGNYEFCSDTLIEEIKILGEDKRGNIYIFCGLSRGVGLHRRLRQVRPAEVIPVDGSSGPARHRGRVVTYNGSGGCVDA